MTAVTRLIFLSHLVASGVPFAGEFGVLKFESFEAVSR
jgi:hypothetical protein